MNFTGPYLYFHGWIPTLIGFAILGLGIWKAVDLVMQVIA